MRIVIFLGLVLPAAALWGQTPSPTSPPQQSAAARPTITPDVADYQYGSDSSRQKFDLYLAKSDTPTPLLLMIHGGGWKNGDKSSYASQVKPYLNAGISVAAINYRFIDHAMAQGVEPPVKACVEDAARALQTLRAKSRQWNIDKTRIAATGTSAGACTSLWLALHGDLADPQNAAPIARESTRLTCAAVVGAQTSLDPKEVREWMPNALYGGHAFGFAAPGRSRAEEFELLLANRENVLKWIEEYSPIRLVSSDDPPVYLHYPNQKETPVFGQKEPDPTHSVLQGIALAEKLAAVGVPALVNYPQKPETEYGSLFAFLKAHLLPPASSSPSSVGSN